MTLKMKRSIKTEAGERIVPIHPELIRLGSRDYVADRRAAGYRRVFPLWAKGADGTYSSRFSKFFNARLLTKLGIKTPRLVFHSLRHNFMGAMRDVEINDSIKKVLIGHADNSVKRSNRQWPFMDVIATHAEGLRVCTASFGTPSRRSRPSSAPPRRGS